jgi:hypothetical protein
MNFKFNQLEHTVNPEEAREFSGLQSSTSRVPQAKWRKTPEIISKAMQVAPLGGARLLRIVPDGVPPPSATKERGDSPSWNCHLTNHQYLILNCASRNCQVKSQDTGLQMPSKWHTCIAKRQEK